MTRIVHRIASIAALLCIASFFIASVLVELLGSRETITQLKKLIVTPGLWILIPALAAAGGSGMALSKSRGGRMVQVKKKRMPIIAAIGLLVLLPCAFALSHLAATASFGSTFYLVQSVELFAGAINITLMGLNMHDGLLMAGRLRLAPKGVSDA